MNKKQKTHVFITFIRTGIVVSVMIDEHPIFDIIHD